MKSLTCVLKITERCNINCTYCYFFNHGEDSYKLHPPIIELTTIEKLCKFIKDAIRDLNIGKVEIGFHGGEPLLIKKKNLDSICRVITRSLNLGDNLGFGMQTNGMLIDEEWCALFKKHKIGIGISIDGPKRYHDKYRVDHRGNGTYDRVIKGIEVAQKNNIELGCISVINPCFDANETYNHLTKNLKLKRLHFLLEDCNYSNLPKYSISSLSKFLSSLFIAWIKDQDDVSVSFFMSLIGLILGKKESSKYGVGPTSTIDLPLITVSSSGHVSPTDELRPLMKNTLHKYNIFDNKLKDIIMSDSFHEIENAFNILPEECNNCCWKNICGAGPIVTRYSKNNGFNNKSIYCEALKELYALVSSYLIDEGYSMEKIMSRLELSNLN